jgi:hypothetical protein
MTNSTTTCSGTDIAGAIAQNCTTVYGESTSTDPTIVNGFSAGEIVISVDLFLILTVLSAIAYLLYFRRVKIKNQ